MKWWGLGFLFGFSLSPFATGQNLIAGDSSFEVQSQGACVRKAALEYATARMDSTTAAVGSRSLRVDFPRGDSLWSRYVSLEPGAYTFSLYARSRGKEFPAAMRFRGPEGEQVKSIVVGRAWKRFVYSFTVRGGIYYLRFDVGTEQEGTVWLDGYQLEKGVTATEWRQRDPFVAGFEIPHENGFVFFRGERIPIALGVSRSSGSADPQPVQIRYAITDHDGRRIAQGERPVSPEDGERAEYDVSFTADRCGLYVLKASVIRGGKEISSTLSTLAVVDEPDGDTPGIEPFSGVACDPGNLRGLRRIGVRRVQRILSWADCQRTPEAITWGSSQRYDEIIRLKNMGFRVTCTILTDAPEWAADPQEVKQAPPGATLLPATDRLANLGAFTEQLLLRYRDYIDLYEIGGEDNVRYGCSPYYMNKYKDFREGQFVTGPVADRLAGAYETVLAQIRRLDKDKRIGILRPTGVIRDRNCLFSKEIFKRIPHLFDLYPLDPYGERSVGPGWNFEMPEDYIPEIYAKSAALIRENADRQPLYTSETGYKMDIRQPPDSESARTMAKYLARGMLLTRILGGGQCYWYQADEGMEAQAAAYGMWFNGRPMPMVPAYAAVARIAENVQETTCPDIGRDIWAAVFRKPDGADAAVWITTGSARLRIPRGQEDVRFFDWMGNPAPVIEEAGVRVLAISDSPLYARCAGKDAFPRLNALMAKENFLLQPVRLAISTPARDRRQVLVQSGVREELNGTIGLTVDHATIAGQRFRLAPGESRVVEFSVPPLEPGQLSQTEASAVCDGWDAASGVRETTFIRPVALHRMRGPVVINGDLSEWSGQTSRFVLNERAQIQPPDPWVPWKGSNDLSAVVQLGWDDQNFYLAAEVTDDVHTNTAKELGYIWNGDSLQFCLDTQGDAEMSAFTDRKIRYSFKVDDRNIGLALWNGKPVLCAWGDKSGLLEKSRNLKVARDEATHKTRYEICVPWSLLGFTTPPTGRVMGLSLVIFDDDDGGGQKFHYEFGGGLSGQQDPCKFVKFLICE